MKYQNKSKPEGLLEIIRNFAAKHSKAVAVGSLALLFAGGMRLVPAIKKARARAEYERRFDARVEQVKEMESVYGWLPAVPEQSPLWQNVYPSVRDLRGLTKEQMDEYRGILFSMQEGLKDNFSMTGDYIPQKDPKKRFLDADEAFKLTYEDWYWATKDPRLLKSFQQKICQRVLWNAVMAEIKSQPTGIKRWQCIHKIYQAMQETSFATMSMARHGNIPSPGRR